MLPRAACGAVLCLAALTAGCGGGPARPAARVAAANPYLESVVRELLGPDEPILCLAGPGMCPGHFDVRPSQVERLRGCRLLLRFDFQASLDRRLSPLADEGLEVLSVRTGEGLCLPETYLAAARQAGDALARAGLVDRADADRKLTALAARLDAAARRARQRVARANLAGTPVLASGHQAAFCRWLGLAVHGTFSGADQASVGELERAVRAGEDADVRFVVANRPEGRKAADALAGRLSAGVVVFGNFPDASAGQRTFDDLLAANVEALLAAAKP